MHCSAGCGRTGTICAIDYIWGLLRTGKLTAEFSLYELVRDMRRQRIAMVQTVEQYVLVHRAVRELFQEQVIKIFQATSSTGPGINLMRQKVRGNFFIYLNFETFLLMFLS